ncbi:WXG100 family type VII secretion target [Demequina oxidasica]|uniref:WXG100 family type VII secretion target n=1 Tax=Demequina oxidasica TaxID=676199 RepID=UPI0007850A9E|nr:WXG100 family type VII secretion target [Demequina oxidasica]
MADVISAEEGALRKGAEAVGTTKANIEKQIKTVRGEIEQLRSFWTGGAANSFTQLMNRWDEESRKLNDVLITLEDALRGTEKDQAASEQSHQQAISGLGSMMN